MASRYPAHADRSRDAGGQLRPLPRLAQEYGRPIADMLERTTRRKDELVRLRDNVRSFSESDGRWSDVRRELHAASNEIGVDDGAGGTGVYQRVRDLDDHPSVGQRRSDERKIMSQGQLHASPSRPAIAAPRAANAEAVQRAV